MPEADHLDRLIHERLRLGLVSALAAHPSLTFTDLKRLLQTTDGNLSVHARKLEEAGYISCTKSFEGRTPRSEFRLTPAGKALIERLRTQRGEWFRSMLQDWSEAEAEQFTAQLDRFAGALESSRDQMIKHFADAMSGVHTTASKEQ